MTNPYRPSVSEATSADCEDRPFRNSHWMYVFACITMLSITATLILVAAVSLEANVDKLIYAVLAILVCLLTVCVIGLCFRVPSIAVATMVPLSVAWILTTTGGGPATTLFGFLFTLPILVPYIGRKLRERGKEVSQAKYSNPGRTMR